MSQEGRTNRVLAGDEAGDVGLSLERQASSHFVHGLIGTDAPEELRAAMAQLRQTAGLPATFDFAFNDLTSHRLRREVLHVAVVQPFSAWAVVLDKARLPPSWSGSSGHQVYVRCLTELVKRIGVEECEGACLVLDEFGPSRQMHAAVRRSLRDTDMPVRFRKVSFRPSGDDSLIQVADLVAGSVLRCYGRRDLRGLRRALLSHCGRLPGARGVSKRRTRLASPVPCGTWGRPPQSATFREAGEAFGYSPLHQGFLPHTV